MNGTEVLVTGGTGFSAARWWSDCGPMGSSPASSATATVLAPFEENC
jgi:hypothetical protein